MRLLFASGRQAHEEHGSAVREFCIEKLNPPEVRWILSGANNF
jgi:hypothetical protein